MCRVWYLTCSITSCSAGCSISNCGFDCITRTHGTSSTILIVTNITYCNRDVMYQVHQKVAKVIHSIFIIQYTIPSKDTYFQCSSRWMYTKTFDEHWLVNKLVYLLTTTSMFRVWYLSYSITLCSAGCSISNPGFNFIVRTHGTSSTILVVPSITYCK